MNVQSDVKRCNKLIFTINMRVECDSRKLIMNI
jgi:hypothetical protein